MVFHRAGVCDSSSKRVRFVEQVRAVRRAGACGSSSECVWLGRTGACGSSSGRVRFVERVRVAGKDGESERGLRVGGVRAQTYSPPTVGRRARDVAPSMNVSACGPNCARTPPTLRPLGSSWSRDRRTELPGIGARAAPGGSGDYCRCRPVGRQIVAGLHSGPPQRVASTSVQLAPSNTAAAAHAPRLAKTTAPRPTAARSLPRRTPAYRMTSTPGPEL